MEAIIIKILGLAGLEIELIFLTGSVLLLLIIMIAYFRRVMDLLSSPRVVYQKSDQIRKWVEESDMVYEKLFKALEERKEIANQLIAKLDLKIEALRSMMASVDHKMIPIAEEVPGHEEEDEVLTLAEAGKDFSEISRQTGLSIGEVQFILNLKRCQESSPFKIA